MKTGNLPAQAQQIFPGLPYFSVAFTQSAKTFPQGMPDDAEVTFENDGTLLLWRNAILSHIENQSVQVALKSVPRRLQSIDIGVRPLSTHMFAGSRTLFTESVFCISATLPERKIILPSGLFLRRHGACARSSPGFGGTIEEGVFFGLLCYAVLCYALCTIGGFSCIFLLSIFTSLIISDCSF